MRLFDIRIGAEVVKSGTGGNVAQLKAYHGQGGEKSKAVIDLRTGNAQNMEVKKLWAGSFGLSLNKILIDAKNFVTANPTEFLILKFDHCSNWSQIAQACREILGLYGTPGGVLYAAGNLNTKTLADLQGKVICAFASGAFGRLSGPERIGIAAIKNLYKPPGGNVDPFEGLQYWGKGGTHSMNNKSFEGKINENIDKQSKIFAKASTGIAAKRELTKPGRVTPGCGAADPNATGMMYWTATGLRKSIEARNNTMWEQKNRAGLASMWSQGLHNCIDNALPDNIDRCSFSAGGSLKLFMPNIVMVDFADEEKCRYIYSLNTMAGMEIVKAFQQLQG